jgi:hypothetical protein
MTQVRSSVRSAGRWPTVRLASSPSRIDAPNRPKRIGYQTGSQRLADPAREAMAVRSVLPVKNGPSTVASVALRAALIAD